MEFHEKLQELRKDRGITQEELAQALYVSRTAISKWESGRGYPSIDSLKAIAVYFSITIDELLSGDKLLSIAEKENKRNMQRMCQLLFGMVDICSFTLIVLPLYPNTIDGYIYAINLFSYTETTLLNRILYWTLFGILIFIGVVKILLIKFGSLEKRKGTEVLTGLSMLLGSLIVLLLALAGEAYAIVMAFILLAIKGGLLMKYMKEKV